MFDDKQRREIREDVDASIVGWMFPVSMGLGFGIGYGLDKLFHSWPWLTIIFSAFGTAAAFLYLFRIGLRKNGS